MATPAGAAALVRRFSDTSALSAVCRQVYSLITFQQFEKERKKQHERERQAVLAQLDCRYIRRNFYFVVGSQDHPNAQNLVWWDMDWAPVLDPEADLRKIKRNIRKSMRSIGYVGPFALRGYGDFDKMPPAFREQVKPKKISKINVGRFLPENSFLDVPNNGDEFRAATFVMSDMLASTTRYPPPANHLFITNPCNLFAYSLNTISSSVYNILLARPKNSSVLNDYHVSTIWYWEDLMEGKSAWPIAEIDNKKETADLFAAIRKFLTPTRNLPKITL